MQANISMGRMKSEPHDFYIGVVLSSKEHVASISSDDIFINSELDLPPELAVLLWTHGQPVETQKRKRSTAVRKMRGGGE